MLKELYLKKEYLLIAVAIVLLLLSYQFAFKNTVEAWQTNRQLKAELARAVNLSYQPDYLKRKNTNLDKAIDLYKADTVAFRNNSIGTISLIAEKEQVKLSEVPTDNPLFHADKFIIQKLDFDGDYFALTKVLNALQSTPGIGRIRSTVYKVASDKANLSGDKKLMLELYLEITK
jgi:hypothetical protein